MIVVDASAMLAALLSEESSRTVMGELERHTSLIAPWLLPYEVANGLMQAERAGRLDASRHTTALEAFAACPWSLEGQGGAQRLVALREVASRHALSACDAAYLELALRHECALVTLDRDLSRAAKAAGVAVLPRAVARPTR